MKPSCTTIEDIHVRSADGTRELTLDQWFREKPSAGDLDRMLDIAADAMARSGWSEAEQFAGMQTIYALIGEAIERLKAEDAAGDGTKH